LGDITILGLPISLGTMLYQAIIFTVLVFVLKKLVFKKLAKILDDRKLHIENLLLLTEQYNLDASKNFETSESILKQARNDAREIMKNGENEAKLIIASAKDEARHILKEGKDEAYHARTRSFTQTDHNKGA
jgi:F-type H+-transporting ATPase subunit b